MSQADYEGKISNTKMYPLDEDGWLRSTERSVTTSALARKLDIDNLVETHIGFDQTHGSLMKKVNGITVSEWLEKEGFIGCSL